MVAYKRCPSCSEVKKSERLARLVSRDVVCEKCGRNVNAFVSPQTTTIRHCSRCKPAPPQPKERETFCPENRTLTDGKPGAARVGRGRSGKGSMGSDDYLQFLNLVETRNNERAEIYSKSAVEDAQKLVSSLSLRELQKKSWRHISQCA
jgi:hypothetical protein